MTATPEYLKRNFNCKACGDCCRCGVVVDLKEALKIIAKHGGQFHHLRKDKAFPSGYSVETSYNNGKCFYLKRNRCAIYKFRPTYCAEFPLEDGLISQEIDLCGQFDAKGRHVRPHRGKKK